MQRDMDLVRKILQWMEAQEGGRNINWKFNIEGYSDEQIGYHAYLMQQAGLIEASNITSMSSRSPMARPICLTWAGHDFLDAAKDENIWDKARKNVLQPFGGVAFSVLLDWLKAEAKARLGLA